jgi:hypothetical protein
MGSRTAARMERLSWARSSRNGARPCASTSTRRCSRRPAGNGGPPRRGRRADAEGALRGALFSFPHQAGLRGAPRSSDRGSPPLRGALAPLRRADDARLPPRSPTRLTPPCGRSAGNPRRVPAVDGGSMPPVRRPAWSDENNPPCASTVGGSGRAMLASGRSSQRRSPCRITRQSSTQRRPRRRRLVPALDSAGLGARSAPGAEWRRSGGEPRVAPPSGARGSQCSR